MKVFTTILTSCLIATCSALAGSENTAVQLASLETEAGPSTQRNLTDPFDGRSLAGNYLAGYFAQRHHDWKNASIYMDHVLQFTPHDVDLLNRAMVLAMGSGDTEDAVQLAFDVVEIEKDSSLALLFLALDAFKSKNYEQASAHIKAMPEGNLTGFILPLLESWAQAASGIHDTKNLDQNSIHLYHAILIADYLDKDSHIESLLQRALGTPELSVQDVERIGDVYIHIDKKDMALELYAKALQEWPENRNLTRKIEDLKSGKTIKPYKTVKSPEHGVAESLYDMARLLFHEYSDDSARVFAHMALFLNPDMTEPQLLLAHITARNERYEEAIGYYQKVSPDHENYMDARRLSADLLEEMERIDEALAELENLYKQYNDLESLIQIGDIYRRNEDFSKAVITYDQAVDFLGGEIPEEYWELHYVRGMSHERLGNWTKAETDLKAALEFKPDHPFVMNYLGYAWADQGINLKQSLELIRKASALQPSDGYITDSLGWVLYRMGDYEGAVPHLEKAVELLPYDPVINDHLGDAYWRVDRKMEARFQWTRARNHAEDEDLSAMIDQKLDAGLQTVDVVKEASTLTGEQDILKP